jgi:serine/threonine-protein kinase
MINAVLDGRFRLEDVIAKGVTGGVFRARDLTDNQHVAVKLLYVPPYAGKDFGARFRREAQVLFELSHPNIVRILQDGLTPDGVLYYAMEFIHGRTLTQVLSAQGVLSPRAVARILDQTASALDAAHEMQIVHRDVTPSNIMLEAAPDGTPRVKLIDFGFAKDLGMDGDSNAGPATGRLRLGVAAYSAPEVLSGKPATRLSDIHALGCCLYVALTGKHPFERENEIATLGAVLDEPPPRFADAAPGVKFPPGIEAAVRKALAKKPGQRPQTAGKLAAEFRAAVEKAIPANQAGFRPPPAAVPAGDRPAPRSQGTRPASSYKARPASSFKSAQNSSYPNRPPSGAFVTQAASSFGGRRIRPASASMTLSAPRRHFDRWLISMAILSALLLAAFAFRAWFEV